MAHVPPTPPVQHHPDRPAQQPRHAANDWAAGMPHRPLSPPSRLPPNGNTPSLATPRDAEPWQLSHHRGMQPPPGQLGSHAHSAPGADSWARSPWREDERQQRELERSRGDRGRGGPPRPGSAGSGGLGESPWELPSRSRPSSARLASELVSHSLPGSARRRSGWDVSPAQAQDSVWRSGILRGGDLTAHGGSWGAAHPVHGRGVMVVPGNGHHARLSQHLPASDRAGTGAGAAVAEELLPPASPMTPPSDEAGGGAVPRANGHAVGESLPPPLPQDSDDLPSIDDDPADAGELPKQLFCLLSSSTWLKSLCRPLVFHSHFPTLL